MTKCYICEKNLNAEAGWDTCEQCQKKYPYLAEALKSGEVITFRDQRGALCFKLA